MKASPIYVQSSLGLLSIAMTASLGGCRTSQAATRPESALAPGEVVLTPQQMRDGNVRLGPVAERDLEDSIRTSGRVALDDLRSAHVFSPVTGRVVKITAQLGQQVHKGQSLAIIESPDIGSAVSDVHKARADVIASEHDWSRKKQLFEQNAASEVDLEIAEDTWRKSKTELERARQKQALLRIGDLDTVTQMYSLTSPIDGEILFRNINPGVEVQGQYSGGANQELFTIGEIDSVWVMGDLYEGDLGRVRAGAPATVTVIAYPGKAYKGQVDWVSGMLDPATRTAKVRCTFANPEKELRPEMYATVEIAVDPVHALAVPRDAIVHLGETQLAFVQGSDERGSTHFMRVPVEVEEWGASPWLVVKRGLERGQSVVVNGASQLSQSL